MSDELSVRQDSVKDAAPSQAEPPTFQAALPQGPVTQAEIDALVKIDAILAPIDQAHAAAAAQSVQQAQMAAQLPGTQGAAAMEVAQQAAGALDEAQVQSMQAAAGQSIPATGLSDAQVGDLAQAALTGLAAFGGAQVAQAAQQVQKAVQVAQQAQKVAAAVSKAQASAAKAAQVAQEAKAATDTVPLQTDIVGNPLTFESPSAGAMSPVAGDAPVPTFAANGPADFIAPESAAGPDFTRSRTLEDLVSALTTPFDDAKRLYQLYTLMPPAKRLYVETFGGVESVSEPFVFELGLVSQTSDIELKEMMGMPMSVGIRQTDGSQRYVNGYVSRFEFERGDGGWTRYRQPSCRGRTS